MGLQPWEGSETDTPPQAQPHVATNWGVTRFGPNTTPIVLPSLILSFYYLQHQGSQTQTLIEGSVEGDKLGRRVGVDGTIGRGGESDQMQNKLCLKGQTGLLRGHLLGRRWGTAEGGRAKHASCPSVQSPSLPGFSQQPVLVLTIPPASRRFQQWKLKPLPTFRPCGTWPLPALSPWPSAPVSRISCACTSRGLCPCEPCPSSGGPGHTLSCSPIWVIFTFLSRLSETHPNHPGKLPAPPHPPGPTDTSV